MEHKIEILFSRSIFTLSVDQRSRFNEFIKLSPLLREACLEGESLLPGMTNLIGDIWVAFYALQPQLQAQAIDINRFQYDFINGLMRSDEYRRWHQMTRGDELLSILTTLAIYEQLKEQVAKSKSAGQSLGENKSEQVKKQLSALNMQQIIGTSATQVKQHKQAIVTIGTADGKKMKQVPMKDQLQLAEQLQHNDSLKKIAELTGRFKKIAQKKQKSKQRQTLARQNVTVGQEIARLLPLELANLLTPSSKRDFLRRYAEQQTMVFDTKGKEKRGRGPIIICMDESSSMTSIKEQSKAFCLALLMIARRQKRDFAIIPFATNVGNVQVFKKGQATTQDLIHLSESFLGGGTNYERALRASLEVLAESEFKQADLIFVTDGSSFLSTSFLDEFNKVKKAKSFACTSVVLKNLFHAVDLKIVERFSDKIIQVDDLVEADEAFAIY